MIQARQELDFAKKSVGEFLLDGKVREKNLHRLDAVRNHVPNLINLPHSSGAEYSEDFVVTNSLPGDEIVAH